MTVDEYRNAIHFERIKSGTNTRYHQVMESRYWARDRAIRILVGLLAILGLFFAIRDYPPFGVLVAFISILTAGMLNILPFAVRAKEHSNLFRLWSEQYKNVQQEELKQSWVTPSNKPTQSMLEKILELQKIGCELEIGQFELDLQLLKQCQQAEEEVCLRSDLMEEEEVEKKSTLLAPDSSETKK